MEFFDDVEYLEDETIEYVWKHDDHGENFLNEMLSLPRDEFRSRFRMDQRTFLSFCELLIIYLSKKIYNLLIVR